MRFFRCLRADIIEGSPQVARRLVVLVLLMVFCVVSVHAWFTVAEGALALDGLIDGLTLGDYCADVLKGMKPFSAAQFETFTVPVAWMLVMLLAFYTTVTFPSRNLAHFGGAQLAASGGRWTWWLAKCAWVVLSTCLYWLVALVALALVALVLGNDMTLNVSNGYALNVEYALNVAALPPYNVLSFLASVPVMTCGLALVQLALSINTRPMVGFCSMIAVLVVSAFYLTPLLPGNYLMTARTACLFDYGMNPYAGMLLGILLGVVAVAAGGVAFKSKDVLERDGAL
ncbi:MAG TPA: hypothetical protein IAC01_00795 [Candidatus Limicola stercorigallinarum]|nr:hypothetical protein [Candidatus Limicola stercorigallinarum]